MFLRFWKQMAIISLFCVNWFFQLERSVFTTRYNLKLLQKIPASPLEIKQDRQYTCELTLRRVHESLLQRKSNTYCLLVGLCVCSRPCVPCVHACVVLPGRVNVYMCVRACSLNQHATRKPILWHNLWPLWLYLFFDIISQTARFSKKCYWA
jgi:hypothetical protein